MVSLGLVQISLVLVRVTVSLVSIKPNFLKVIHVVMPAINYRYYGNR